MKYLKSIGQKISKNDQKTINGGRAWGNCPGGGTSCSRDAHCSDREGGYCLGGCCVADNTPSEGGF